MWQLHFTASLGHKVAFCGAPSSDSSEINAHSCACDVFTSHISGTSMSAAAATTLHFRTHIPRSVTKRTTSSGGSKKLCPNPTTTAHVGPQTARAAPAGRQCDVANHGCHDVRRKVTVCDLIVTKGAELEALVSTTTSDLCEALSRVQITTMTTDSNMNSAQEISKDEN